MVSSSRPRTPSSGTPPPQTSEKSRGRPEVGKDQPAPRRSSLGLLLRRTKSGNLSSKDRKQQALAKEQELERQQREAAAVPKFPPRLPDLAASTQIPSFGGEDHRPDTTATWNGSNRAQGRTSSSMDPQARSYTMPSNVAVPPMPSASRYGEYVDPYARTESMTHRGRYSYASSAVSSTINGPRRVRRRKDPTPFNVLIIGAKSAGKTSFLNFLKTSLALPPKKRTKPEPLAEDIFAPRTSKSGKFLSHYLETEIDGERVGLTLWDSEGLDRSVVDLQLREMSSFLESKFEETFTEEMKVVRAPGVKDTHIHATFLILDPARLDQNIAASQNMGINGNGFLNGKFSNEPRVFGGLDEDLDLQVLRTLQGKTTVIPVIAKADTITTAHITYLKKMVWDSLKRANLDPLEALGLEDEEAESPIISPYPNRIDEGDEDISSEDDGNDAGSGGGSPNSKRLSSGSIRRHKMEAEKAEIPYLPLSIISPDMYDPGVIGRKFPWGFADPLNEEHCDFVKLKEAVFTEWRAELREASREIWYEGWRTSRLKQREAMGRR